MMRDEKALAECLADAGCDDEAIVQFMLFRADGKTAEAFRLLATHRRCLLDVIHQGQKRLDVLDYLIYSMKKEQAK